MTRKPKKALLVPQPPTAAELLASLAAQTRHFFDERRDMPMPEEIAAALPILERAAHDERYERPTILAAGAYLIGRSAACEDKRVAAILDRVDTQRTRNERVAWTVQDLEVLARWGEHPARRGGVQ